MAKLETKRRGLTPLNRLDCVTPVGAVCPAVGCRYHLAADVKLYTLSRRRVLPQAVALRDEWQPGADPNEDTRPTCALDAAEDGPRNCEQIAQLLPDLSRSRVEQVLKDALRKLPADVARFLARRLLETSQETVSAEGRPRQRSYASNRRGPKESLPTP